MANSCFYDKSRDEQVITFVDQDSDEFVVTKSFYSNSNLTILHDDWMNRFWK